MFCYVESKNIFEYPKHIPLMIPCGFQKLKPSIQDKLQQECGEEIITFYDQASKNPINVNNGYFIYKGERDIIFILNRYPIERSPLDPYITRSSLGRFLDKHKADYEKIATFAFHEYHRQIDFDSWMEILKEVLFDLDGPYFLISIPYDYRPDQPYTHAIDGVLFFKGNYPFSLDFEWSTEIEGQTYRTLREYLDQHVRLDQDTDDTIIQHIRKVWQTRFQSEQMGTYYRSAFLQLISDHVFICAEPDPYYGINVKGFDSKTILYKPELWTGKDLLGRAYTQERIAQGVEVKEVNWLKLK